MASARGPESRTIATLPWPGATAVAMAAMVSVAWVSVARVAVACRGVPEAAPHSQRGTPAAVKVPTEPLRSW